MNLSEIKQKIQEKYPDYKDHTLEVAIEDIPHLTDSLRKELETFLQTGEYPKTEAEGYDFKKLLDMGFHPLGAIFNLDLLIKEPEEAKQIMKRGFDRIVPPENV